MIEDPLLRVVGLKRHYPVYRGFVRRRRVGTRRAVDGVTFDLHRGETLALVGESGSGKTTLSRRLLGLTTPTAGFVMFRGRNLSEIDKKELKDLRRHMQIVFQDSLGSLDPMHKVAYSLKYPMKVLHWGDKSSRNRR